MARRTDRKYPEVIGMQGVPPSVQGTGLPGHERVYKLQSNTQDVVLVGPLGRGRRCVDHIDTGHGGG